MGSKPIFNLYGQVVAFADDRDISEASKMDIAKTIGDLADREFTQACYDADVNSKTADGLWAVADSHEPERAATARTLLEALIEVHGRKNNKDAA